MPSVDRISGRQGRESIKKNLRNLAPIFRRHWKKVVVGAALILFSTLLAFPVPLVTRYLVDNVILAKELNLLGFALGILIALTLAEKFMGMVQGYFFARLEQGVVLDIQEHVIGHVLRLPKSFFDRQETGYLMSRISSDALGLSWFFSGPVVHIISNTFRFVGGVYILFHLEWRLAIVVMVLLPGLVACVRYFARRMHVLSHHGMERRAAVSSHLQESLSSTSLIKAFSSEGRTTGKVMERLRAAMGLSLEQHTVAALSSLLMGSFPDLARFVVLALGGYWVIKGEWSLGSLLAYQSYLGYVFGPALFLANMNLQLQNAMASLERVSALFEVVPEEHSATGRRVERLKGDVEFRDVSFSYDGREPVLRDVNLRVCAGEQAALVGPSGVGKTTLLSLILCFYRPRRGEVLFDGISGQEYDVTSLRNRIGYVSQGTLLLTGTVMENLCYGHPEAEDALVIRAAKAAGAHEFIQGLPGGYHALIGEKGVNLSEGQKQRLSLARALVRDPDILVLDEPSSALDSRMERSIFEALPKTLRNKTLFIAAQRLSTIKHADKIFLLNDAGTVTEGTHESLMATSEFYRSVVAAQLRGDRTAPQGAD